MWHYLETIFKTNIYMQLSLQQSGNNHNGIGIILKLIRFVGYSFLLLSIITSSNLELTRKYHQAY